MSGSAIREALWAGHFDERRSLGPFELHFKNDRLRAFDRKVSVIGLITLLFDAQSMVTCRNALSKRSFTDSFVVDENDGLFWSRLNLDPACGQGQIEPEERDT